MMINWSLAEGPLDGQGLSTHPGGADGLGLVQPGAERAFERNLTAARQHLKGGQQEDEARLFTVGHGKRMRHNGQELKHEKFRLDTEHRSESSTETCREQKKGSEAESLEGLEVTRL
ncbi:hypothetical protein QYF61_000449 [Mycteria americana]|uniref:Uncharacterized protein n=1 Tax=Mycteria americana TaxID=33587 RepID=A0AAN7NAU6_MYCAM|nr:hypothetical protein QYF61_000449 [Mycteria americana]